jgi:UDP-N-acetylglucosamine--N-acetylmuramyl-(pentapeptide) pyrophosphoryl-undecaprenol N-acetylglucosamine transferase
VIAAGGTAGHVVPAIAVADALRAEGADVRFAGGERAEAELVPAAGYELDPLRVEGLSRTNPLKAVRAAAKAALALGAAARLLHRHRADAVLAAAATPPARSPAGRAARDAARARRGRLAPRPDEPPARRPRPPCLPRVPDRRAQRRPLPADRPPGAAHDHRSRGAARAEFGIPPEATCVLIFGGSLGARSINLAAVEAFADAGFHVLHVPGARDFAELRAPGEHYHLREYVSPFGQALIAADLAVARAGGSVFELAQYGLPAILIPYPHASADHQTANARWMAEAGAATILPDAELTPSRLRTEVDALLGDPERLAGMAAASRRLARPDAAAVVAREVLAAAA